MVGLGFGVVLHSLLDVGFPECVHVDYISSNFVDYFRSCSYICLLLCGLLLVFLVCFLVPLPGCFLCMRGRGEWGVWLCWLYMLPSASVGRCLLL